MPEWPKCVTLISVTRGFWGFWGLGVDEDAANKRADEVLRLMARNYAIVEELQGHETVHYSSSIM